MTPVLRKRRKEALSERLLHYDSDQLVVRASQRAQHAQPLVVGAEFRLALVDVAPVSDADPLLPTHDDASHPRARTTPQSELRQQSMAPRAGVARHVERHLHVHAVACLLQLGFDYTVKVCDSEVAWTRGCVSSNG